MNYNDTLAKYVRKVCIATIDTPTRVFGTIFTGDNGQRFEVRDYHSDDLKVGDKMFIAKPIPVLKHAPKLYEIHEVIVPVARWDFTLIEKQTDTKKKRLMLQDVYQRNQSVSFKHRGLVTLPLVLIK